MSNRNTYSNMDKYKKVGLNGEVDNASPHRLIQMLMEGVLLRLVDAKQYMQANDIARKGEQISGAISIIDGLKVSLDKEAGGEIAENLDALYDYMMQRLLIANINNESSIIDEVSGLLLEIKSGWDVIPEEFHNRTNAPAKAKEESLISGKV